jgi:hypothetical protein
MAGLKADPEPKNFKSIDVPFFAHLMPELTKLLMNFFWNTKKARTSGTMIMNVAAHTFAHCITASLDFAKSASPTVKVLFSGEFVTIRGQRKLFQ